MLNMISLEKHQDTDWPSGKFTNIYKLTKERFAPDDDVAEMDMEDDLRKIKCARTCDPKKILDNSVAIKVQYGCVLSASKKTAIVVQAGRANYVPVITIT